MITNVWIDRNRLTHVLVRIRDVTFKWNQNFQLERLEMTMSQVKGEDNRHEALGYPAFRDRRACGCIEEAMQNWGKRDKFRITSPSISSSETQLKGGKRVKCMQRARASDWLVIVCFNTTTPISNLLLSKSKYLFEVL